MIAPGDRLPPGLRWRPVGLALTLVFVIVVTSQLLELFVNRFLRPDLEEWGWISEAYVIVGLAITTVFWIRLRLARTAIADLERQRVVVETELALAAQVQRALLPPIPPPTNGIVWHAIMETAGQVGGDYYDFIPISDDRMCVVLADVSGKGVPAAVFMSNTRAVLRAAARDAVSPDALLTTVSERILQDGKGDLYVTAIAVIVDTARHTAEYANAGHPAGVLLRAGRRPRALSVGGPPLGLLVGARYQRELFALEVGDLVVLVSDGVTEALDAGGEVADTLGEQLASLRAPTPEAACTALIARARGSTGPPGLTGWGDDRTVVAFARPPS